MRSVALLFAAVMASGCMTINATKSITVRPEPDEKIILVQANAQTVCKDFVIFRKCTLTVDVAQIK